MRPGVSGAQFVLIERGLPAAVMARATAALRAALAGTPFGDGT